MGLKVEKTATAGFPRPARGRKKKERVNLTMKRNPPFDRLDPRVSNRLSHYKIYQIVFRPSPLVHSVTYNPRKIFPGITLDESIIYGVDPSG